MPEKSSEFIARAEARERLGFRVWRCHTSRNMKKTPWLIEAIREKVEKEEKEIGPPPGPKPFKP